jgi:two-component system chemotaxis response regulator CheY
MLTIWSQQIRRWGLPAEIHTALNGKEGLLLLQSIGKFDLIITDFQMPEMDGLDFIQNVRKQNTETPIFLFSAYVPELDFITEQMENVFFFEKPIITPKLRSQIKVILDKVDKGPLAPPEG